MKKNDHAITYFENQARLWTEVYDASDQRSYGFLKRKASVMESIKNFVESDNKFKIVNSIDIGCGAGPYLEDLCQITDKTVIGLDSSKAMINECKKNVVNKTGQIKYEICSSKDIKHPDNSFDLAIAVGHIEYFEDRIQLLKEFYRILKPGAIVIITFPNKLGISRLSGIPRTLHMLVPTKIKINILKFFNIFKRNKKNIDDIYLGTTFTRKEIRRLSKLSGFKVKDIRCVGYSPIRVFGIDLAFKKSKSIAEFIEQKESKPILKYFGNNLIATFQKQ